MANENENLEQGGTEEGSANDNSNLQESEAGQSGTEEGSSQEGGVKSEAEDGKEIYGAPEAYDYKDVQLPEGMTLDQEILDAFNPMAKKFNLSQKSSDELMGLAVKLVQKQATGLVNGIKEAQEAETTHYQQLLESDKEIGENKEARNVFLDTADIGYNAVAPAGVKEVLKAKGLDFHPDIVKMFHKIGQLCEDDKLPDVKTPIGQNETPAEVLYGGKKD